MQDHIERLRIDKRYVILFLLGLSCLVSILVFRALYPPQSMSSNDTLNTLNKTQAALAPFTASRAAEAKSAAQEAARNSMTLERYDAWRKSFPGSVTVIEKPPFEAKYSTSHTLILQRVNVRDREWPDIVRLFHEASAAPGVKVRGLSIVAVPEKRLFSQVQLVMSVPILKPAASSVDDLN